MQTLTQIDLNLFPPIWTLYWNFRNFQPCHGHMTTGSINLSQDFSLPRKLDMLRSLKTIAKTPTHN